MEHLDLFPEEMREARRNRKLKRRVKAVGAKMRLADDKSGMQNLILAALRKHGPSAFCVLLDEIAEICDGADEVSAVRAEMRCMRTVFDMWKAGVLWRHEWMKDVWTWGIRGEQNKQEYIHKIEEMILGPSR